MTTIPGQEPAGVRVTEGTLEADGERLAWFEMAPGTGEVTGPCVVLLHGAGQSTKDRFRGVSAALAGRGRRVVAFDFSGHGASTGQVPELSLRRRFVQAAAVITQLVPAGPLHLIGNSMSGDTLTRLLDHPQVGPRVARAVLVMAAAYAEEAADMPFDYRFTAILRRPRSWAESLSFLRLERFSGPVRVISATEDTVIPAEITQRYAAIAEAGGGDHVVLEGAPHRFFDWVRADPVRYERLVTALAMDDLQDSRG